jgi:membrane-associated PAP2 superfamily phosphatase
MSTIKQPQTTMIVRAKESGSHFILTYIHWWLPVALMLLITPFTPTIDLALTRYFYEPSIDGVPGHFSTNNFFNFMFVYGIIPADITAGLAIIALILSYFSTYWKQWRSAALVLILTLAVGAGFITHAVLKDHWGRPRPKQVEEFGGAQAFRPYYQPNFYHQPEPSKSFPCGHCSMGFYFFALALVGKRKRSRVLYVTGLILAWTLGIALSVTRIAQGGHFFSDVLVTALIMWLTALTFDWLIFSDEKSH